MESTLKRIIVTGCNKGVGYGIIENLAKKNFHVIMACRNIQLAQEAKEQLLKIEGLKAKFDVIELDVSDSQSIDSFIENYKSTYQTADILLNNAGIAWKGDAFDTQVVEGTFKTNVYGTVELSEKILPLINESGKIITIGSTAGTFARCIQKDELLKEYQDEKLDKEKLFALAKRFYDDVQNGTYAETGFGKTAYGMSKLTINLYQRFLAQNPVVLEQNIQVYGCCPGWVRTDMAGDQAPLSIQQGALTPVYLVELPHQVDNALQGKFFYEQKVRDL